MDMWPSQHPESIFMRQLKQPMSWHMPGPEGTKNSPPSSPPPAPPHAQVDTVSVFSPLELSLEP